MTAFELCGESKWHTFTVGKGRTVWESAVYCQCDKIKIARLVLDGGKPFMLGLRYKQRYIKPGTIINIIN